MRLLRTWLVLLVGSRYLSASLSAEPPATFGLTNIWTIELRVTPDAWRTVLGSRTFTRAIITVNGITYTNVALRQKGGGTSGGAQMGRPGLHLNFKQQRVAGVQKMSLNNNFFDTTYLRDVLSYKLCNDFGVAAPRTAFAKVYLRTGDTAAPRYLGLYTATEIVDEAWCKGRFGTKGGLLMKPRAPLAACRTWNDVNEHLVPKTQSKEAEKARMVAFPQAGQRKFRRGLCPRH